MCISLSERRNIVRGDEAKPLVLTYQLTGGFAVWAAEIRRKAAQARHFVLCITSCGIQ
jgi:hypothetical protein